MDLYEIKEEMQRAIESLEIDEDTGEVLNIELLDTLKLQFDEKAENIALYIKNVSAEAAAIREEEKKLAYRRKSMKNKAERLKNYLSDAMSACGYTKVETPRVALGFRKSNSVQVDDGFIEWAKKNAPDLLSFKDPLPDKTAIKKCIADGKVFEFARMAETQNLTIK